MSNLFDANKRLINTPAPQVSNGKGQNRYKNADCTELDWFDTHPRPVLPSSADLDKDAEEKEIKAATSKALEVLPGLVDSLTRILDENPRSSDDVPQVQLPSGQPVAGLVSGQAVSQPASQSDNSAGNVVDATPAGSAI